MDKHNLIRGPLTQDIVEAKKFNRAYELTYELNNLKPTDNENKNRILKELLGSFGENTEILTPFNCNIGSNIHVGKGSFININCVFLDTDTVSIGDYTLLGPGVNVLCADHPTSTYERIKPVDPKYDDECIDSDGNFKENIEYTFTNMHAPITIGDRCWIGANAIICSGVTIGDNVVIGAESVVTRDIPSNTVAVGSPARVIKENK